MEMEKEKIIIMSAIQNMKENIQMEKKMEKEKNIMMVNLNTLKNLQLKE